MRAFFNVIRAIVCLIGLLLYIAPFYYIYIQGLNLETLKMLGICWILGMLTMFFSAKLHPKIDERYIFTQDTPSAPRISRSPEEFEKWLAKQNFEKKK